MNREATPRQVELLQLIERAPETPTVRELAAQIGLSRSATQQHIEALRAKGLLPRPERRRAGVRRPHRPLRSIPTRTPVSPREAFYSIIAGLEHLMQRPLEDWEVDQVLLELRIALPALPATSVR